MTLSEIDASRRHFLAGGALLGALFASRADMARVFPTADSAILNSSRADAPYLLDLAENHIQSVCLQCNTGCGITAKIQNGVVTKIDGNPYNPWTLLPHLPYDTPVDDAAPVDGAICPKGQSGLQTAYDPYRIRKVLKRAGKRGDNQWVTIPFEDAIREICEGGKLFADVEGEQDREVEGLDALYALRDADVAKAMAADIKTIHDEKDADAKAALVAEFRTTHAPHLDVLIDPDHPDLGPKNNQIVAAWGRLKDGRGDMYKRFAAALGTPNAHGHTTVCQGSLYFTCKAISEQYAGGKFTGGKKFYFQADTENSRFVLFVGANLFEGNYGPPNRAVRLTENLANGTTKIAVADPRFGALASKAWKWLPVKPGTDGALAMGFIRWMLDNEKYDAAFLSVANKAAAVGAGETSWTNAALLAVKDGEAGALARAADVESTAPLSGPPRPAWMRMTKYEEKFSSPWWTAPRPLWTPTTTRPRWWVTCSSTPPWRMARSSRAACKILRESAEEHTVAEWAEIAGITEDDLVAVVTELTSYGKAAAVDIHRGVAQHTNGFHNVLGWMTVNMLLGNYDHKGGMSSLSTYDTKGKGKGELFDVTKHPGEIKPFGIYSIRYGLDYEKTSLFEGYPAKRNWYPLASDIYEEIIPSIGDAYPYRALFLYGGTPACRPDTLRSPGRGEVAAVHHQ